MSLSLLLFLSHLILSAWAQGETRLAPGGHPGPAATERSPGRADASPSCGSTASASSSSSTSASPAAAAPGCPGGGSEQSGFQWSASGRRTGSLYCRVGIGFHLQIYPDGKVNGTHEANMLS
ncbi:fibroblast growth factor 5 isoform X2 [Echinops telfairi]|nr:fibroblast growth factor 5 isoform X2 [Echinops telfairi]